MEKQVYFKNKSGEKLSGYLHVPESGRYKFGIVLAHCFTCSRHVPIIRKMCDFLAQDFLVLRFDFSGNGESEGKFEDSTYGKELKDFDSAINFLLKQGVSCVGALGHSMGSAVTLLAGPKNKNVKVIVSMAGNSSTQGIETVFDKKTLEKIQETGKATFSIFGKKVTMTKEFFEDAKKLSIEDTLKKSKKPICILHGEKDTVIPVENARKLYFYSNEPKDLKIIPEGDHMFTKHLEQVLEIARLWFKKYLK